MEMIERNIATGKYTVNRTNTERNSVMFLYDHRNRVLMPVSNRGVWGLPGGIIDQGENPFDAAVRELGEETGVMFDHCRYDRANEVKFTWRDTRFYVARYNFPDVEGTKRFIDPTGEIRHVEFPRIENLFAVLKASNDIKAFKDAKYLKCGRIAAPIRQCMIECFV